MAKGKDDHWIEHAHMKPGALHREMGIPADDTIPVGRLKKATDANNPAEAKRANAALTLRKLQTRHSDDF